MPWAAGVYTRGYPSWSNDAASNLPISASKFDTEDNDFAAGLNNCLTKDGLSSPNTPMTWGLSNGQIMNFTRGSDGPVIAVSRTGGSNNPSLQFIVTDASGAGLGYSGVAYLSVVQATGQVTVGPPVANNYAESILANATAGQSLGLLVKGGTNASDVALLVQNQAGSATLLQLFGDGHGTLGPTNALGLSWNTAGNVTIPGPSSGAALNIGPYNSTAIATSLSSSAGLGYIKIGDQSANRRFEILYIGTTGGTFYGAAAGDCVINSSSGGGKLWLSTNDLGRMSIDQNGAIVLAAANAGNTLTIAAGAGGQALNITGINSAYAAIITAASGASTSYALLIRGGTNSTDAPLTIQSQSGGSTFLQVLGDGSLNINNGTGLSPVYAGIPQNVQNGNYTFVLADANKHVYFTGAGASTWTIPANASVAYPVGTAITLVNFGSANITLSITTDTLIWMKGGANSTGSRTIASAGSVATLLKVTATAWSLSGNGIS